MISRLEEISSAIERPLPEENFFRIAVAVGWDNAYGDHGPSRAPITLPNKPAHAGSYLSFAISARIKF